MTPLLRAALFTAALVAVLLPSRAPAQDAPQPDLLSGEQLAASGGETVHEAIRRLRPAWVRLPSRGMQLGEIAVYVDSVHAGGAVVLRTLPADTVLWVQYSSPTVARERFGVGFGNAVIHVSTRLPLSSAHTPVEEAVPFSHRPMIRVALHAPLRLGDAGQQSRGLALGLSQPMTRDLSLVLSARYGSVHFPAARNRDAPHLDRSAQDVRLGSFGLGVQYSSARTSTVAPFFQFSVNATDVRLGEVTRVRDGQVVPAESYMAMGPRGEAGVDVQLSDRMAVFTAVGMEMLMRGGNRGESWASLSLGTSFLLNR